jgi:hypothetical protein
MVGLEQNAALEAMRDALVTSRVSSTPINYKTTTYVYSDASVKGLGVWIVSGQPDDYRTFAFWSRKTTSAEKNYPATDLEALRRHGGHVGLLRTAAVLQRHHLGHGPHQPDLVPENPDGHAVHLEALRALLRLYLL